MGKAFGFDFGTTNSLISIIEGGRCIPLLDRGGLPHPSVVCYQGGQVIVGRKAKERLADAAMGVIGNIVRSPKTLLGEHKVYVEGVARNPKEIVSEIVRHVRKQAQDAQPGTYDRAVVTIPVDMNGARRKDLRDAFLMADVSIVQFIHEPLAALYGHLRNEDDFQETLRRLNRELILVFDWGGGTLDLTLCQIVNGMLVQLMNDGCSHVGGDVIDDMLKNEIVRRCLRDRGIDEMLPQQADAAQRLLDRAERAKIELSEKEQALVFVPDYFQTSDFDVDIEYTLRRAEFEEVIEPKIREGIQRIHGLLDTAGVTPASIAVCLATGGMINMPMIKSRLREIFGPQRVQVSESGSTVISEGAAWIAHDGSNLSLAKNIELLVARNSYFPVIKAGASMPREGEIQRTEPLSLYCTDPRDGIAKFQIACPKKPGRKVQSTDDRMVLDSLSIQVDSKAKPFFERIEFTLTIDHDLILHAAARSLVKNDADSLEVHNLEFGLQLPSDPLEPDDKKSFDLGNEETRPEMGSISLRSNIAVSKNQSLIPGELIHQIDRFYMDTRNDPPEHQVLENLYYQPCSICHRPSNHPRCQCASNL